jgi:hypothetical protein
MQQVTACLQLYPMTATTCLLAASLMTLQQAGMQQQGLAALLQACRLQEGLQEQACMQRQAVQESVWA